MHERWAPSSRSPRQQILEPADRIAEVMFGLIMALTFTGSLSISDAGRNDVHAMLIGALGCNVAWGLIDGIFYVMVTFADRSRETRLLHAARSSDNPAKARKALAASLPDEVEAVVTDDQLDRALAQLAAAPGAGPRAHFGFRDVLAGLGVATLVFCSTLPIAVPFVLFDDVPRAMRTSNAIAIVMLFLAGALYGRVVGGRSWLVGAIMVLLGTTLVTMTIALGG